MITIQLSVFARELGTNSVKKMGGKAGLISPFSVRALAQAVGHPLEPKNLVPDGSSLPLGDVVFQWTDPGSGTIRQATRWIYNVMRANGKYTHIASGVQQGPYPGLVLSQSGLTYGASYAWGIYAENDYSSLQYSATAQFHIQAHAGPPQPAPTPKPPVPMGGAGYSGVEISNCHTDHRPVYVWVREWPPGIAPVSNYLGEFKAQYNDNGQCPWDNNGGPADPFTVPVEFGKKLESKRIYEIFCVDPDANGCTVEAADELIISTQACVRLSRVITGDKDGETFKFRVD